MKESISYTYLLNMMLIFIVISFCVIVAVLSYTKAYRLGSKIANALEVAEGYNILSQGEIARLVTSFGYQQVSVNCGNREFEVLDVSSNRIHVSVAPIPMAQVNGCCIYEVEDGDYYYYGITTYMMWDFPIINNIKIPVYNTTEKIYDFS